MPKHLSSRPVFFTRVFCLMFVVPCGVYCRYQFDDSSEEIWSGGKGGGNGSDVGLIPPVFNLARHASIVANGTCGEGGDETYCKLVEHVHNRPPRPSQCQVCSADSHDKSKRHPIRYAIDESNRWWQSPTLQNGRQYEWITITINLKKVYQVAYIIIKAANSPRPGNWILERSKDGIDFLPWQYFAVSDDECWTRYGIVAKEGKPNYNEDDEVICTSYFSKITPFEGGEIHTSLVNGRPGSETMSEKLTKFTMAQFIRLRLQKIRTLHGDLMTVGGPESRSWDKSVMRRYFYSIKDIAIGGSCVCFGHASECITSNDRVTPTAKCMCQHNTCGDNCDVCCPLFNQYQWGPGNSTDSAACEECQCYGHSDSCVYDPDVHAKKQSINIFGTFDGGGVCLDCKAQTTGYNCEKCKEGYYRPSEIPIDDPAPCVKCNCSSLGSMGYCVPSVTEAASLGKNPGDCICKDGFSGRKCDECGKGYRGYPHCEPCPCNLAGIIDAGCEGSCVCKENVEGSVCNACKKGYFNLNQRNVDGCTQCFCHGVATQCISSNFAVMEMSIFDKWFVTDLHGTKITQALQIGSILHVANEEFATFNQYYWTVGDAFSGKLIHSYGLNIVFHVSWVQARGDTSGRPIPEYDVIVQSTNSMLAFNFMFHEGNNATIEVTLNEMNCFVLPDVDNNVIQRVATGAHQRTPCTRYDIMEGLSGIKRVLIRAKFHTDQIEGMLHSATFEVADPALQKMPGEKVASSVEICSCPKGYTGTSCENCAYGHRKSSKDSWLNDCIKCDCNGHSPSCDFEGNCVTCEHNTTGAKCEHCVDGFYGDPSTESLNSCKPCECPLSLPSNNFSPTCTLIGSSYQCTSCPDGYAGPFCERCSNGYYGIPTQPGDFCKPCNCNVDLPGSGSGNGKADAANICDHLTGECLVCPKYTTGWNCDECLTGYFGDPMNGSCSACDCFEEGALNANCDLETGQCYCRPFFEGQKCNECIERHGSPKEGCPSCDCNESGSKSHACDTKTGQCLCKPGIGGRYCNKCLNLHFGFSFNGCEPCSCDTHGSDSSLCDLHTGQCHCLPNVEGRKCDECSVGFWNITSGAGCSKCECFPEGSLQNSCDADTGQCYCKRGVGGLRCNACLDKHYGLSIDGCKECDPCETKGHFCDPNNGHCVCPPNTEGENCEKCQVGFWGHSSQGCKACNCSQQGSTTRQCSAETGKCQCSKGFEGDKCNACKVGFYSYPTCTACNCDPAGSAGSSCSLDDVCSCNENGDCDCKENVNGKRCDRCQDGTYGLDKDNPEGCMKCFCFQRSNRCSQGYFKWLRLDLPTDRNVQIRHGRAENQLKGINNLIAIPDTSETVFIENDISFGAPLYWQLPHIFLGDKVLSYNGYLRFHIDSSGSGPSFSPSVLSSYPLVQIQGNHKLILEYFSKTGSLNEFMEVRLHEDLWKLKHGPFDGIVTKEVMMVALQNLQHILVRATNAPEVFNVTLYNVSLDMAIPNNEVDTSMAHGIEVCDCPPEYNSTSCQNPKLGFYRWYKREYITSTVIIDLVGQARPCDCNGRAELCDTESGNCVNCSGNTAGPHCDVCASGYYGDASEKCHPCPCPSVTGNHADACFEEPSTENQFQCFCKAGYTGKSCERCDYGFFGKPWEINGQCDSCRCNPYGSVSDECHEISGQCNCRPGVMGRDCSRCSDRHVIIGGMCASCNDSCTGELMRNIDDMARDLHTSKITPDAAAVWKKLFSFDILSRSVADKALGLAELTAFMDNIPAFHQLGTILSSRIRELQSLSLDGLVQSTYDLAQRSSATLRTAHRASNDLNRAVNDVRDYIYGKGPVVVLNSTSTEAKSEATQLVNMLEAIQFSAINNESAVELSLAKEIYAAVLKSVNSSTLSGGLLRKLNSVRDRLEDLGEHLNLARKEILQAQEVTISGRELFLTAQHNLELVDNITVEMDVDTLMTSDKLSEGGHGVTEVGQVLLMIEDIVRDLRNTTKEVEIRDNTLFDLVPLYRTEYAQGAFDQVELLKREAKRWEEIINSIKVSGSESLNALTAYQRITDGFGEAFALSSNASIFAGDAEIKIQELLSSYNVNDTLATAAELIKQGLALSGFVENTVRNDIASFKSALIHLTWKIKNANETLRSIFNSMEEFDENLRLDELVDRIMEVSQIVEETKMDIIDMERKISEELEGKVNDLKSGASISARDITSQMNSAQAQFSKTNEVEAMIKSKNRKVNVKHDDVESRLTKLTALILQSRHKSDTVRVSIGPDQTGTCYRLYNWPAVSEATSIRFNFAPTNSSDSLLFYWPSSVNEDYVSIEMVGMRIKASWELGSGLRTLVHPKQLTRITENSDDPDNWVTISMERIGSGVTLDVKAVEDILSSATEIMYQSAEDEATLMDLSPDDLIHIGGMSIQSRSGLVDSNGLSGCIHNLVVNNLAVGLWNFVGNEGCGPCTECLDSIVNAPRADLEYYLDGRGYALVSRIESNAYNPKFFDFTMEFKTYSETALLFLTVNETVGQMISLELKGGLIIMQVRSGWDNQAAWLQITTSSNKKYNTGEWVKLRAIWVNQKGKQTGQLTVGGNNYKEEKHSMGQGQTLELYDASYQIGGLSPAFNPRKWQEQVTVVPFVGCMKNILIDSSTYDLMSGLHFGIKPSCGGKALHVASFEGDGFGEFYSKPMGKDFLFGFSFKTISPTGVLVLSTHAMPPGNVSVEPYYAAYLENGKIRVQFGMSHGPTDLALNEVRYDDGKFHAFRLVKRNRRVTVFMDDAQVGEGRLPKKSQNVTPPSYTGLFIGGLSGEIRERFSDTALKITRGFAGCIQYLYFGKTLLNFNNPITHKSQNLGQCPSHFNLESSAVPLQFSTPKDVNVLRIDYDRPYADHACVSRAKGIEQEDSVKALHFGDSPDSYATISLDGSRVLRQNFNLSFHFRTFYPDGLFFKGGKRKANGGNCLAAFLKDSHVVVRLDGGRYQELLSPIGNLHDGLWHQVAIVRSEDKLYLYIDNLNATVTNAPKLKAISKLHVGGSPPSGMDCFENLVQKPDNFKGCLKNFIVNSHSFNLDAQNTILHNTSPCFRDVQRGTFFKANGYAIYSHNFTLGNLIELELEFRSDAMNGILLSFNPSSTTKYPTFSIFLQDGNVVAKESFRHSGFNEAVQEFSSDSGHICNGEWHSVKANYENGAITLRVDSLPPIYAVMEPGTRTNGHGHGSDNFVFGSLYIGGLDDDSGRSATKSQFHGCIRNISINRQRKDWTDMAQLTNVVLNACPT